MFFANPTYLWALLGLLVPIGIHLWSRREAHTLYVGSVEFLEESESINARAFRPDEWWLLILRILIITTVAILLAGPRLSTGPDRKPIVYVAEASLLREGLLESFLDSLNTSIDIRLLTEGLPVWNPESDPPEIESEPSFYWQLVPELNALPADSIVIFTRAYLKGIRSSRPFSSPHIQWMVVRNEGERVTPIWARGDSVKVSLISIRSGAGGNSVEHRELLSSKGDYQITADTDSIRLSENGEAVSVRLEPEQPFRVLMDAADDMESEQRYLRAALSAVSRYLNREVAILKAKEERDFITDLHIWLRSEEPPEVDGPLLFFREDSMAHELIVPTPVKDHYRLTRRLSPEISLSGKLPERMMEILLPPVKWEEEINRLDRRQMEASVLNAPWSASESEPMPSIKQKELKDLTQWFWLLLLILFGGERLLALKRRQ